MYEETLGPNWVIFCTLLYCSLEKLRKENQLSKAIKNHAKGVAGFLSKQLLCSFYADNYVCWLDIHHISSIMPHRFLPFDHHVISCDWSSRGWMSFIQQYYQNPVKRCKAIMNIKIIHYHTIHWLLSLTKAAAQLDQPFSPNYMRNQYMQIEG